MCTRKLMLRALRSTLCALVVAATAHAQTGTQRAQLDRVRKERAELEQRMRALQSTVHDLSEEVGHLDRQADATSRLVSIISRYGVSAMSTKPIW